LLLAFNGSSDGLSDLRHARLAGLLVDGVFAREALRALALNNPEALTKELQSLALESGDYCVALSIDDSSHSDCRGAFGFVAERLLLTSQGFRTLRVTVYPASKKR
jgi:hypothetical protein